MMVGKTLINAIACQQITLTLGIRLLNRLAESYGMTHGCHPPTHAFPRPVDLARAAPEDLRELGFSSSKARAIIELAQALVDQRLDLDQIRDMDDDSAVAFLRRLRGVGRWTAEYVLLRHLGRLRVFPGDDVGARKNLQRLLGMPAPHDYAGVRDALAPWRPFGGLVYFHLLLDRLAAGGYVDESPPI